MVERVVVGPWKTNCYIYSSTQKECIIIDPGGSEEEIASRVDVLNMVPVGIALTHGHVDHLAALGKLRDGYAARGYKLPIAINPAGPPLPRHGRQGDPPRKPRVPRP